LDRKELSAHMGLGHTWCTSPTRKHLSRDFTFATQAGAAAYLEPIFLFSGTLLTFWLF